MKKQVILKLTIAGFVSVALMSGAAFAQSAEMTKPKGAVGTGITKEGQPKSNQFWWPDLLDLSSLTNQDTKSNPYGADFSYAEAFNQLDLDAAKKDIDTLLTTSQDWWPSDFGNYGPFFIRMAYQAEI